MSSSKDVSAYKCTLSPELLKKAKRELNEDPKTCHLEVKNLRKRLEKVPGLQPRTDTLFLLRFLRARKFDQERAFKLMKNYYEVRIKSPDFYNDLKPSRVKHVFDAGILEVLDKRDNEGCTVVVIRVGRCDPEKYPLSDIPRAMLLVLAKVLDDEDTLINGVHVINNMDGYTLKDTMHYTPSLAKHVVQILQDILPLRLKRLDFVKEPAFFDAVFALMRPFIKEKLANRIFMNGQKLDKMHATINPEILPTDLGGPLPEQSNKAWMDALLASDAYFEEDNKFGFVRMNVSGGTSVSKSGDADMQGLGGTFRKLEI